MEPLTMFASTICSIGALHLLFTAAERLGKGIYNKGNQQAKREEWYCFFQPSDLLGTDWGTTEEEMSQRDHLTDADRLEQRRRQQANRPRLQA